VRRISIAENYSGRISLIRSRYFEIFWRHSPLRVMGDDRTNLGFNPQTVAHLKQNC
jgi:hypothetical protein